MTSATVIDGFSPIWDDRLWLAKGRQSRLYPAIRDFLREIEASAASVTADLLNEFRHRAEWPPSCAPAIAAGMRSGR